MKVFAIILLISMMFTAYGMELERVPADSDVQKLPQLPPLSANTAKKVALNLSDIETGQYNKPAAEYSDRELALLILLSNHQSDQTHLISALEEILKTEKPETKKMVLQHSTRVTNILGQNPDNAQPLDANAQQPDGENQADQSTLLQHLTDHSNEKAVLNILTKALTASNNKNRKHKFLAAGYGGAMTILAAIIPIIVQHYAK